MATLMTSLYKILLTPREGSALVMLIIGALIVGSAVLWALTLVPPRYRKTIVAAVTFLGGLILALEFFLKSKAYSVDFMPKYANVSLVIGAFALLLGLFNLFRIHGIRLAQRKQGWGNSLAFFIAFFGIMLAGFIRDYSHSESVQASASSVFRILFSGFLTPLSSTMFSMIAFYIASAAYRAFRIRSTEAALMMVAAAIIMLALVPAGLVLTAWLPQSLHSLRLENLGHWLLSAPNMAVQRALAFGLAVGGLATGLRIWLSLERGSFFDRQL